MFKNPRRGRQERKFKTNVPKILDLKFRTDIFRKLTLGAPDLYGKQFKRDWNGGKVVFLFFRGHCDRYFWDIWLKIHVLPNFDMLLQLVLTKKKQKNKKRTVFVFTESWPRDQPMHKAYWRHFSDIAKTSSKFGRQ